MPLEEIEDEGSLLLNNMEEWGVPKLIVSGLRTSLLRKLTEPIEKPSIARGALRALIEEYDSWSDYTDDYEEQMQTYAAWLFGIVMFALLLAVLATHYAAHYQPLLIGGILAAGIAGSCVSVLAKMPVFEVGLSEELDSYKYRIYARVCIGLAASIIGCGLLASGIISISVHGLTFSDLFACSSTASCSAEKPLVLIAISMLFGFSERALMSFDKKVFGDSKT